MLSSQSYGRSLRAEWRGTFASPVSDEARQNHRSVAGTLATVNRERQPLPVRNRVGLSICLFVGVSWLAVIIADRQWWQLLPWAVFSSIGVATWFVAPRRRVERT